MGVSRGLAGVTVVLVALICSSNGGADGGAQRARLVGGQACHGRVIVGVLPSWARSGFRDPNRRMPYVVGRSKAIAGILWGHPLTSPPPKNRNNKILWVSHRPPTTGSDLRIRAQRMSGSEAVGRPVTRTVSGGPGPSIINLPSAGCWRLNLSWSGRIDTVDLRYIARR
jgi:hypothetical protein